LLLLALLEGFLHRLPPDNLTRQIQVRNGQSLHPALGLLSLLPGVLGFPPQLLRLLLGGLRLDKELVGLPAVLLGLGQEPIGLLLRLESDLCSLLVGLVEDLDGTYKSWFGDHGVSTVLQRPDFYLFGAATDGAGAAGLLAGLRDALGAGTTSQAGGDQ